MKFLGAFVFGAVIAVFALQERDSVREAAATVPDASPADDSQDGGDLIPSAGALLAPTVETPSTSPELIPTPSPAPVPAILVAEATPEPTPVADQAPTSVAETTADPTDTDVEIQARTEPPEPAFTLPPLTADDPYWHVELEDHGDGVVWLPLGTTEPRPMVIATHGNYDRPEWTCERWAYVLPEAFIICPRGMRRSTDRGDAQRYHHRSRRYLREELEALLGEVQARYGERIAEGPPLFTGFSQGAIFGKHFMVREPERYPNAVLASGGDEWSRDDARRFAEGGGQRVLFVCGQASCARNAESSAERIRTAGADADVIYHEGSGHTYDFAMVGDTVERLSWLLEGDERWDTNPRRRHWVRADEVDP